MMPIFSGEVTRAADETRDLARSCDGVCGGPPTPDTAAPAGPSEPGPGTKPAAGPCAPLGSWLEDKAAPDGALSPCSAICFGEPVVTVVPQAAVASSKARLSGRRLQAAHMTQASLGAGTW